MVPTVHANWRYFEMYDENGEIINQWFGGGQDLTPYYLFEEDAKHFHQTCKNACDKHNPEFYPNYKRNVMSISGMHIAMKQEELAVCFSII